MSKSVKEQAFEVLVMGPPKEPHETWTAYDRKQIDALAAAGLLNDERAQACVEACKAHRLMFDRARTVETLQAVWDAGAAYDEPKPRTQAEIVADLVAMWDGDSLNGVALLLSELAASVKGVKS